MDQKCLNFLIILMTISIVSFVLNYVGDISLAHGARLNVTASNPIMNDPSLKVDLYFRGLKAPTSMSFLGPDDILVTQKNEGTVERIINGVKNSEPLISVPVATKDERGLLGLATSKDLINNKTYLFLYYTEKGATKGEVLGNRVYKYELSVNGSKPSGQKLLVDLPGEPGPGHNGGVLKIGPDNNVYATIGDMISSENNESQAYETQAQNIQDGKVADGRAGIIRITQDGKPVGGGILGNNSSPLDIYFAYGIKNSFGFDFDPVTGNLWDTENGPDFGDEINMVESGFNSGWKKVQGIWNVDNLGKAEVAPTNPEGLVNFERKGKYSPPEFTWDRSIGPTALKFLNTDKLGLKYENDILVGDIKNGNIYFFNLAHDRNSLILNGTLNDKVADGKNEYSDILFAHGFGGITDLEVGPDGRLYVLVYDKDDGRIYRIQ